MDFNSFLDITGNYSEVENVLVNNFAECFTSSEFLVQQFGPTANEELLLLNDDVILVPTHPNVLDLPLAMNAINDQSLHQIQNVEKTAADSGLPFSLQKKDKICLVCGDKALGYNFNAVSCESCKAFFRRNAHKTIRGRCEGTCEVTVDSRSFCKKCRLKKCFSVGMRKDMILNEEQKKQRKQKIIINKLRKHGQLPPEDTYAASPQDFAETFQDQIRNQSLEDLRIAFPKLSDSDLLMLMKLKSENENIKCNINDELAKKYPSWSESQDIVNNVILRLPDMEKGILQELRRAHEETDFLANTSTNLKSLPKSTTEFLNIAEGFVRKTIKVAKYIEFFKMINKEDQIALLKGSVVEIMMLRSAVNYDTKTESWSLSTKSCIKKETSASSSGVSSPDSASSEGSSGLAAMREHAQRMGLDINALRQQAHAMGFGSSSAESQETGLDLSKSTLERNQTRISADILKMGNPEAQTMFLTYSKFVKSLMREIHGDLLVLKLLIMLSLFSPDRPGLVQQGKVEEIQECYAKILQKYVKERFPEDATLFAKIIMKLTDLRNINEVHTKMLLRMKVDNIEPLLVEIFDLPS